MKTDLESLQQSTVISALDRHFANAMTRIADDRRPEVVLAAALVSRQASAGHVCLDIPEVGARGFAVEGAAPVAIPDADAWLEALRASPLVAAPPDVAPLILDARGRLYLQRFWRHQQDLAARLLERAAAVNDIDPDLLFDGLARLFGPASDAAAGVDPQREAAALAVTRRFSVISGGPGTGKTSTVAKILALVIEQALAAGRDAPVITLVAPTGKAAATLGHAIRRALAQLDCDDAIRRAIPESAVTIHRGLGVQRRGDGRFLHDARSPLATDLLLVDEASMVDLALMHRLVDAVPAHARLILLGDEHQLASVEAGAVLGDLCGVGAAAGASGDSPIADCIARLTRSYRYDEQSGIGALARAINEGDATGALEILDSPAFGDVTREDPGSLVALPARLRDEVVEGFRSFLGEPEAEARLEAFSAFRLLATHRRGPGGVEELNRHVETALLRAALIPNVEPPPPGRPVLITRNDYEVELFNGDIGITLPGGRVVFPALDEGAPRRIASSRLPAHESAWAMTVHKSQGSEFEHVCVVLPERVTPLLSRELLYTAITRARRRVTIFASRASISAAIDRRIERASGLRDALWGTG